MTCAVIYEVTGSRLNRHIPANDPKILPCTLYNRTAYHEIFGKVKANDKYIARMSDDLRGSTYMMVLQGLLANKTIGVWGVECGVRGPHSTPHTPHLTLYPEPGDLIFDSI